MFASIKFKQGTVIPVSWLQGVNDAIVGLLNRRLLGIEQTGAAIATGGTLTPAQAFVAAEVVVRNGTTGDIASFLISGAGKSLKLGGSSAIVLGVPTLGQLGINAATGAVTNGYSTSQAIYIRVEIVQ